MSRPQMRYCKRRLTGRVGWEVQTAQKFKENNLAIIPTLSRTMPLMPSIITTRSSRKEELPVILVLLQLSQILTQVTIHASSSMFLKCLHCNNVINPLVVLLCPLPRIPWVLHRQENIVELLFCLIGLELRCFIWLPHVCLF